MCIDHKKGVNRANLFRQLDRDSPQIRMSRRPHVAVAGSVSKTHCWCRVLVTFARTHDTMASAAQCAWQSVVFRFLNTGVVNDV